MVLLPFLLLDLGFLIDGADANEAISILLFTVLEDIRKSQITFLNTDKNVPSEWQ